MGVVKECEIVTPQSWTQLLVAWDMGFSFMGRLMGLSIGSLGGVVSYSFASALMEIFFAASARYWTFVRVRIFTRDKEKAYLAMIDEGTTDSVERQMREVQLSGRLFGEWLGILLAGVVTLTVYVMKNASGDAFGELAAAVAIMIVLEFVADVVVLTFQAWLHGRDPIEAWREHRGAILKTQIYIAGALVIILSASIVKLAAADLGIK